MKRAERDTIDGFLERLSAGVSAAGREHRATASMVAGIEYEVQRLRRDLAGMFGGDEPATEAEPETGPDRFQRKLRHPENLKSGLWTRLQKGA